MLQEGKKKKYKGQVRILDRQGKGHTWSVYLRSKIKCQKKKKILKAICKMPVEI